MNIIVNSIILHNNYCQIFLMGNGTGHTFHHGHTYTSARNLSESLHNSLVIVQGLAILGKQEIEP